MANRLVPYIQDTDKWTNHFIKQAMKQTHPEGMMKCVSNKKLKPNLVSPSVQLIAQAESDIKRERSQVLEEHAPIKATPEFAYESSPNKTAKQSHRGQKRGQSSGNNSYNKKAKKNSRDAFDD